MPFANLLVIDGIGLKMGEYICLFKVKREMYQ